MIERETVCILTRGGKGGSKWYSGKRNPSSNKIVVKATTTYDNIKFTEIIKDDNVYNNSYC
jgi:hypothetical protein